MSYSIHIRARDTLNQWGPLVNGGTFTVNAVGPPGVVPNFVGQINGQNVNGQTVTTTSPFIDFSWSHASSSVGLGLYQLVVQPVGGPWHWSTTVAYPATSLGVQIAGLQDQVSYSIHIRARDTLNQWGPFINGGTFTVSSTGPSASAPHRDVGQGGQEPAGPAVISVFPGVESSRWYSGNPWVSSGATL